ncbi:hypothetical protein L248_2691 [Schleiferilactobacillus shenzhenensis LY-73]|uniref:Uncharacterized protein n=2 Tax=Schleiferilactobacillus shenzhenensis TaxID=1231337 RepID=U4TV56_9LACO|nr:hypothetical protein L248_2691 [Schleiferilactobacillus shenzhenensis LY-73]
MDYFEHKLLSSWRIRILLIALFLVPVLHQQFSAKLSGDVVWSQTSLNLMMGFDYSSYSSLYYLMVPAVAGLIGNQIVFGSRSNLSPILERVRLGGRRYIMGSALVGALIGGLLVTGPVLVDWLIAFWRYPVIHIDPFVYQPILSSSAALFPLFLNHPVVYLLLYLLLLFLFSGLVTAFSVIMAWRTGSQLRGIGTAFIISLVWWVLTTVVGHSGWSPAIWLIPNQGYDPSFVLTVSFELAAGYAGISWWLRRLMHDDYLPTKS